MRRHLLALSLLGFACQTETSIQTTSNAIINGTLDTSAAHDAVVALTDSSGFAFCTGTYIGQRTIVSAAHCVEGGAPDFVYFGSDANADADACINGNDAICARFVAVTAAEAHPDFDFNALTADVSVVRIAEDPAGVTPIPILSFNNGTNFTAADEGKPITFLGFGITNGFNGTGGGQRLIVGGTLGEVGPGTQTNADQVFYDQPTAVGGPCSGDSGGPLLIVRNGVEHLGAVTSFGDATCSDFGVSARVDTYEDFIREFQGGTPPPPDPDPLACGADDVCQVGCGQDGNPVDPDCQPGNEDVASGCSVVSPNTTLPLPLLLLSLLFLRRRKRA